MIKFRNVTVRQCKVCGGTGVVVGKDGKTEACPVCMGAGEVKRIAEGTIRYEPHFVEEDENGQHIYVKPLK